MKKTLTITFGAVLAAGLISTAHANVDLFSGATVSIAGTYTKTSNNGLSVGDVITNTNDNNPFTNFDGRRPTFLEPDYEWDYALGLTFAVPNSPSYVFINYDHFDDSEARQDGPLFVGMSNPPATVGSGSGSVDQRSDEFQLGLTRELSFGRHFDVDLSAFFDYARIKRNVFEVFSTGAYTANRGMENKMRGYGAGLGALGRVYPFACQNWSIFAGIANSLLYTKEDFQLNFNDNGGGDGGGAARGLLIDAEQSHALISKNDIKFGIEYDGFLNRQPGHDILFSLALGMRFVNYINAFKNGNTAFNFYTNGSNAVDTGSAEDWGRWGPYLQLTIGGPKT